MLAVERVAAEAAKLEAALESAEKLKMFASLVGGLHQKEPVGAPCSAAAGIWEDRRETLDSVSRSEIQLERQLDLAHGIRGR
jgi:hypothetical protein